MGIPPFTTATQVLKSSNRYCCAPTDWINRKKGRNNSIFFIIEGDRDKRTPTKLPEFPLFKIKRLVYHCIVVILCPEQLGIVTSRFCIILWDSRLTVVTIICQLIACIRQAMRRSWIIVNLSIAREVYSRITCTTYYVPCFQFVHETMVDPQLR